VYPIHSLGIMLTSTVAAVFLWIGLRVLIEGEPRAAITTALALTTLALAAFHYGLVTSALYSWWSLWQDRVWWWFVAIASVSWYAVAIAHVRPWCSFAKWRLLRLYLVGLTIIAVAVALAGMISPTLFLRRLPGEGLPRYEATPWYLLQVGQVQAALVPTLLLFVWLRRRLHGRGLLRWFTPAALCALVGAAVPQTTTLLGSGVTLPAAVELISPVSILGLSCFLLGCITRNRKLLGQPLRTRDLFRRWSVLVGAITAGFALLSLSQEAPRAGDILVLSIMVPLASAAFDWNSHRISTQSSQQSRRLIRASLSGWPKLDPQDCANQAQHLLDTLVKELDAEFGYLRLQVTPASAPFVLRSGAVPGEHWQPLPKGSDARFIEINAQRLGFILLRHKAGIPYSTLELDLAEACGYSIAGIYLDSRQSEAFNMLVVRRERERQEQYHSLQRVLHDRVVSNLDAIYKAAHLLPPGDPELVEEIREAARESMQLIRKLLQGELANPYPDTLVHEGLLTALYSETRARYAGKRFRHVTITFDPNNPSDASLSAELDDELLRVMFSALHEAIHNAMKYAGGEQRRPVLIIVRAAHTPAGLLFEVLDDGVGFAPELATPEGTGMGLHYHQAAVRLNGATMLVESRPGAGTQVQLHVPAGLLHRGASRRSRVLTATSGIQWRRLILEAEQHPGGRLLINDELSDLTRLSTLEEYHRLRWDSADIASQIIAIDRQRHQAFLSYVHRFPFKEIVDRARLGRYIASGQIHQTRRVEREVVQRHVRDVITLLRTQENYHLALSNQPSETNFAVKPGHAVLLERRAENGQGRIDGVYEGICDTDPATIVEFTRRFEATWEAVPHEYRERRHVIAWLEARLRDPCDEAA